MPLQGLMQRVLPHRLASRIALATFAVLLLVQLAGVWLLLDDRGRVNYRLLAEYAAQRMAGIASVLDAAAPAQRAELIRALSVQPTTVTLDLPWGDAPGDTSDEARAFLAEVQRTLQRPLAVRMLTLERLDPRLLGKGRYAQRGRDDDNGQAASERRGRLFTRTYVAQVRLTDGTVVTFNHLLPAISMSLPQRLVVLLVLVLLATSLLTLWAVRRLTRPLEDLAQAAAGLARNLEQPALAERGSLEVRQATQAFNAMQRDIRRLVETRAQALSAVSHDLRLPITRIRLRLEGEVAPELQARITRDLDEMDQMIGHTLDFLRAGAQTEPSVPIHLDALLDGVIEDMQELGATVTRSGLCHTPLSGRPQALRRAFSNLLDNARLYGGGDIKVTVTDAVEAVRVAIRDYGPGIAPDQIERVLEPYFRVEASRARHTGGTGLGLPIARAIIESQGGSLVLSRPDEGHGLLATVVLPRSRPA